MPNWSESMQQTYEFYQVDPATWKDKTRLATVKSCTIERDAEADTLGSASFDIDGSVGECYIRVYLITIQNGVTEKHPLGTFIVQTPSSTFDGMVNTVSMDAYTPLLELKEKQPDIGYYAPKSVFYKVAVDGDVYTKTDEKIDPVIGDAVSGARTSDGLQVFIQKSDEDVRYCVVEFPMDIAYRKTRESLRAPVVKPNCVLPLYSDFIADTSDTWFTFLSSLIAQVNYRFELDELGRVLFAPVQDAASMQPVWTYDDSNSSILYPEVTLNHDLYGIPNVVEVVYYDGKRNLRSVKKNEDQNSPTSIQRRGRQILYRDTEPQLPGLPLDATEAQKQLDNYAEQLLKRLSTVEYRVKYSHGYCPVRLNDCVLLNYEGAGLSNVKAKVISQSISCKPGCKVTETAVFTKKLWR